VEAGIEVERNKKKQAERDQKKAEAAYQRFRRAKPAQLRQATWDWLLDQGLRELPADGRFGPLIQRFNGLGIPDLLRSTVIRLDGLDYVIDAQAARDLVSRAATITLVRLRDRERVPMALATVLAGLTDGPVFDQLDV
jgi:hypothetical protein